MGSVIGPPDRANSKEGSLWTRTNSKWKRVRQSTRLKWTPNLCSRKSTSEHRKNEGELVHDSPLMARDGSALVRKTSLFGNS